MKKAGRFINMGVSSIWSLINQVTRRFSKNTKLPVPVISVGNILAGGVGKTEWISLLAKYYLEAKKKPMVLMRGYKSDWENKEAISNSFEDAMKKKFPDEALLLLKKNPGLIVGVGKNRKEVFKKYFQQMAPDVVLLDDGYQHFSLQRDLDILVHDFSIETPILRDFYSEFNSAELCVSMSPVPPKIQQKFPHVSWILSQYEVSGFYESKTGGAVKIPPKALLFSGIGNPERFENKMKQLGIEVQDVLRFSDHHVYTENDILKLQKWKSENQNLPLLTTLKDCVKLKTFSDFSFLWVEVKPSFLKNEPFFWEKIKAV